MLVVIVQLVDEFLQGPTAPQTFHMAGLLEQVQHIENQNALARHHPGMLCIQQHFMYTTCI